MQGGFLSLTQVEGGTLTFCSTCIQVRCNSLFLGVSCILRILSGMANWTGKQSQKETSSWDQACLSTKLDGRAKRLCFCMRSA